MGMDAEIGYLIGGIGSMTLLLLFLNWKRKMEMFFTRSQQKTHYKRAEREEMWKRERENR